MRKITMEVELNDDIAAGLDNMQFKAQTSGRDDVWAARHWVKELLQRYEEERNGKANS
jgi:hypothetical protein